MSSFLYPLLAFFAVAALLPLACRAALRLGYVDAPGGRKDHDGPVPPVGGIVIFPVFIIISWFAGFHDPAHLYFYIALTMIVTIGAIDDRIHVPAWIKFFAQIAAAALLVWSGAGFVRNLDNIFGFGALGLSFMAVPFSLAAIVLLINAINLMDGLDGLAGGFGLTVCFWLLAACYAAAQPQIMLSVSILTAILLGFLLYNARTPWRKKASIFLGDAGSLGLGLCIAYFCIDLAQEPGAVLKPISVAWVLALPVMDVCAQFYRRVREGRHPFDPDRGHFHHHPIHAGLSVQKTTALLLAIAFLCGALGFAGSYGCAPQWILTILWIAVILAHMNYARHPENYIKFFARFRQSSPVDN